MRFYHIITLTLAIICLFGDSGLGAPSKGRYKWVKCRPGSKNANCETQMGPLVPLAGLKTRLPPSAVKYIDPIYTEEATPKMEEQSGEGSGNSDTFEGFLNGDQQLMRDGPEQEDNKNEEEGSTVVEEASGDIDYSNYVFPEKIGLLSPKDLKDESMIP
ncbi:serglycin [Xyrauchen texanus]|uniref:serglycin n=1 Tax=Xyrauchen texanus TaxID=154827 RepID=UPI002241D84E|nr:serglycin [Xyrauchen texanus]